jgi:glycine oxidase ThiO
VPAPEVLVVGGGIVGAACARALAHRGVTVTVVEAGPKTGAATQAAAGMLAPFAEALPEDPVLSFNVRARDLYRDLAPQLKEETGIDIGLWNEGILQVVFSEEEATAAKGEIAWQRQSGFMADWLTPDELREHAPGIAPEALGAAFAPEDGALEPVLLRDALLDSAESRGARLIQGERVDEVLIEGGAITGVRTTATHIECGALVLAAGCWSGRIVGLPRPVSVEPIRGQMVSLDWPMEEPRIIAYGGGGYVVFRGGEALAGSTMEHVGFDASVTSGGVNHLLDIARRLFPPLRETSVRRTWAGLRPGTPDGRPMLGRDPEIPNLWYATGHGRNGILLAGITGEVLAQLFLGEEVEHELEPLDPGRFWTA